MQRISVRQKDIESGTAHEQLVFKSDNVNIRLSRDSKRIDSFINLWVWWIGVRCLECSQCLDHGWNENVVGFIGNTELIDYPRKQDIHTCKRILNRYHWMLMWQNNSKCMVLAARITMPFPCDSLSRNVIKPAWG